MSMYPDEQTVVIDGEQVSWPGLIDGKFSSGDFADPAQKPSFIPAETINLLVDNIASLITKLGGAPDNAAIDQLANVFSGSASAKSGVSRDASGRTKMAAPSASDDVAIKQTVDNEATARSNADSAHAALTAAGTHGSTVSATANRGVHRDASGRAQFAAPSASADAAIKQTVDDEATARSNADSAHAALTAAGTHGSTVAATANRGVHRDASGRAQIVNPSADADIANKGWTRDFVYPVGSYYVQYPDAASNTDSTEFPTTQRPATLFGGTWSEQWSSESVFFRTRGTLSDTDRASGYQADALQGHYHGPLSPFTNFSYISTGGVAGGSNQLYGGATSTGAPVTDGSNGTPRTAAETRVTNRRIKVWKRTA